MNANARAATQIDYRASKDQMTQTRPRTFSRAVPFALFFAATAFAFFPGAGLYGETRDPKTIVAAAVATELNANRTDHSAYIYRDHDITPDHDVLYFVVETPQGNLKKKLEDHERPLTPQERQAEDARIKELVSNPSLQARERRDATHDDEQAEEMLKLLPTAYIWTIASETPELITLNFKPDPNFTAPNMEARVLSAMAGQIVVARNDDRIRTIRGALVDDVKFGFGIFGRLKKGGSFQVERREVAPHHWEVTETHTKIEGHALFFKSIGSIEDETRTDFKPSPAKTFEDALQIINTFAGKSAEAPTRASSR